MGRRGSPPWGEPDQRASSAKGGPRAARLEVGLCITTEASQKAEGGVGGGSDSAAGGDSAKEVESRCYERTKCAQAVFA